MFDSRIRSRNRYWGFIDALVIGRPNPVNKSDSARVAYDEGFADGERAVARIVDEVATRVGGSEPDDERTGSRRSHSICSCGHSINDHFVTGCTQCWCREFWSAPDPDRASSGALLALASEVHQRARRRHRRDDPRRPVREEPQEGRGWQMEFRHGQAGGYTVTVKADAASTAREAVRIARSRHDLEDLPLHRGLGPTGEPFGSEVEDRFEVPRPEDTPSDVARLAVDEARDPSVDDEEEPPDG